MPPLASLILDFLGDPASAGSREPETRRYQAGQVIFNADETSDGLYLIRSGRVRIVVPGADREPLSLATLGAGELLGEMGVVDDAPRSATAIADLDTEAIFVSRVVFLEILKQQPEVGLQLVREFSQRIRALNQKYVEETLQAERLALVGRFVASIVHDFRNPLSVVSMTNEIISAPGSTQDLRERYKEKAAQQVSRMSSMLDELLEFSKPTPQPHMVPSICYRAYFENILVELSEDAARHQVQVSVISPAPEVFVKVIPQRLSRVFFNLVTNAIQQMSGGGTIRFRFAVQGDMVLTEVADTGGGIAPELAGNLFKPFATHGKAKGTGLGLAVCKKIVEDYGGSITARNEPGLGAVFAFQLPIQREQATPLVLRT